MTGDNHKDHTFRPRVAAGLAGQMKYIGGKHAKCGTAVRYVSNGACVECSCARKTVRNRDRRLIDLANRSRLAMRLTEAW